MSATAKGPYRHARQAGATAQAFADASRASAASPLTRVTVS